MKRIILTAVILALAGVASAVELFPSADVPPALRAGYYCAYAVATGYYELAPDGETHITNPAQRTDNAALAKHVKRKMVESAKTTTLAIEDGLARRAVTPADGSAFDAIPVE